jgi:hypothetical protein
MVWFGGNSLRPDGEGQAAKSQKAIGVNDLKRMPAACHRRSPVTFVTPVARRFSRSRRHFRVADDGAELHLFLGCH